MWLRLNVNHRLPISCRGHQYCLIIGKDRNGRNRFTAPSRNTACFHLHHATDLKVKVECHTLWRVLVGFSSPLLKHWADRSINYLSLRCIWPVRCQTYGYLPSRRAPLSRDWRQIALFDDGDTCVNNLPWQRNGGESQFNVHRHVTQIC